LPRLGADPVVVHVVPTNAQAGICTRLEKARRGAGVVPPEALERIGPAELAAIKVGGYTLIAGSPFEGLHEQTEFSSLTI